MTITGDMLIAGQTVRGRRGEVRGIQAATGQTMEPAFGGAAAADVEHACRLAEAAFDGYRERPLEVRARFLESVAAHVEQLGNALIERCMSETGLPRARLEGERGRTTAQLRLFAQVVRDGGFLDLRIDPAQPDRKPAARPDLRLRNIPLGPVAVFGASNFPLAFSVAGGDTASALAAGCPVVVKAHNAHPGTSEMVGRAVTDAVRDAGLPPGVFSLLFDSDYEAGAQLVGDPRIKAVGFTGSRDGGMALLAIAQARREPIPVYAEMSSVNPVIILPAALASRSADIATAFAASLTLGAGQFCTNPGVVLVMNGPGCEAFEQAVAQAIGQAGATTMLSPSIRRNYIRGVEAVAAHPAVVGLAAGREAGPLQAQAHVFSTTDTAFLADPCLHDEVFGPFSLMVRCRSIQAIRDIVDAMEGQLTIAVHADADDHADAATLMRSLERKAGRILFNGFGTGVEVGHAMVHGGPFPATSDGRSTSVGSLAIERFLRPVAYQDAPFNLLPDTLRTPSASTLPVLVDGQRRQV
jgi:alpha-ketoglutaric semialdehyde dehydrogenase